MLSKSSLYMSPLWWGAVVVYSLEYWPVVHDVAVSIPANLMDGE